MAFEHSLSIRVVRKHRDGVTVECPLREELMNSTGVLHGGIIASIADEAAWHAMIHAYRGERPATTTELKVNYLRPIAGKKATARAYALRTGRTLFVSRIDLFDTEKRLSAVSVVTYMLLDGK
jgi:acyl-CoA thioesterase